MSRQTFIFVSAPVLDADLMHVIEQALGGQFVRAEGSDPYIQVGTVAVYVDGHEFDDDDIAWPQGADIPLQSEYPAMIEIRDTGGDLRRQQEIASKMAPYPFFRVSCHFSRGSRVLPGVRVPPPHMPGLGYCVSRAAVPRRARRAGFRPFCRL